MNSASGDNRVAYEDIQVKISQERVKKYSTLQVGEIQTESQLCSSLSNCWKTKLKKKILKAARDKKSNTQQNNAINGR